MIIVKFYGGLGNQIFQYAFARELQEYYKEQVYMDLGAFEKYKIRKFALNNLDIIEFPDIREAGLSSFQLFKLSSSQKMYHVIQKLIKIATNSDQVGDKLFKYFALKGYYYNFDNYYYEYSKTDKNIKCVYGYFQSEKYFKHTVNSIKQELLVKVPVTDKEFDMLNEIKTCNAIGVSMRLGDDYKGTIHDVCKEGYYYQAMDYIADKVDKPKFYIFSDRIDYAKNNFNFKYPVTYIEDAKDYEGLRYLYNCKHFVIANSSFSWLGAYLSSNPEKIVVAPNKWYNNSKMKPDIYLDSMVLLEV